MYGMKQLYIPAAISALLIIWLVRILWKRRRLYKSSWELDGPTGYPLFGNVSLFIRTPPLNSLVSLCENYPDPVSLWLGPSYVLLVNSPKYLEIILNHPNSMKKSQLYDLTKELFGEGLATAPVHKWRKVRKMINPKFSQNVLNTFVDVFSQKSEELLDDLRKLYTAKENILELVHVTAVKALYENILGVGSNAQDTIKRVSHILVRIHHIVYRRMVSPWCYPDFIFKFTSVGKKWREYIENLNNIAIIAIREKRRNHDKSGEGNLKNRLQEEGGTKFQTVLEFLLEIDRREKYFSEEDLTSEIKTLIIGGSDTLSTTLSFALVMLGMHPEIQGKVYEEASGVLGPDDEVVHTDLKHLSFLEMVLKETMRLFPPIPVIMRELEGDVKLGPRIIPTGTHVMACIYYVHRNPEVWKDPLKFTPERFLPEECSRRHKYAYLPGSGGPRNCIGMKYAMMFMQIILAKVVKHFEVSTEYEKVQDVKCVFHPIISVEGGFKLSFKERN